MSKPNIRNCSIGKKYSQKWNYLTEIEDSDLRYCGEFDKGVYFCHRPEELAMQMAKRLQLQYSASDLAGNFLGTFPKKTALQLTANTRKTQ